ncbi:MAG TPA: DUF2950 domain-containing protein [Candidatus Kryptonia bacterium]|nr:DUF2950 domain-containing protein [Candidatus Kryptonia bacterium]
MNAIDTVSFACRRSALALLLAACLLPARPAIAAGAPQKHFATPEEAVQALIVAVRAHDQKATLEVLGATAKPLISSGDRVADRESGERFVQAYDEANSLVKTGDDKAVLQTGKDGWPFPIPVVKSDAGWRFDSDAGKEEILNRRIGANELWTIQACLAYVDAQREYYDRDPDHDGLLQYAQKFTSTPGKRDGLYWRANGDEAESPLGAHFARARAEGYYGKNPSSKATPYHGYYYRILTAQGPDARGGAYDYVVHGGMMGGFALVAFPATYGNSGVMTFIVNHDGVVFQKDLGPNTAATAEAMKMFNPDSSWKPVEGDALQPPG